MSENLKYHQEQYSPGYGDMLLDSYRKRSVIREAAFFVDHIHPGMNILDCGCGPGTITLGLANIVKPGTLTGFDIEHRQVEMASAKAIQQVAQNASFIQSDCYQLPFDDNSFDAVFCHALLQHLKAPLQALKEMYRVLRPGGVIGVRDDDQGSLVLEPENPHLEKLLGLLKQFMRHHGGDPSVGRKHRALLREAGFSNTYASASAESDGNLDETRLRGNLGSELAYHMSDTAVEMGWASREEMLELAIESRKWGEHPDAFDTVTWCEAVGWK